MQELFFAIVAGEASGDLLGADLVRGLKLRYPNAKFEGIGGPLMQAEGVVSLYDIERLSIMGFWDPLKRLGELLSIRRKIINRYKIRKPLAYIGIDAPDFNLNIECKLRRCGVKTVHYVSPSVWAWRQGRIAKIKRGVDLMLTLFPFESEFYRRHDVQERYVGHPIASKFPRFPNMDEARSFLDLSEGIPVLTLMPGSREAEVKLMAELFFDVAANVFSEKQDLAVLVPASNELRYEQLRELLSRRTQPYIKIMLKGARQAMEASDAILLTSGTSALEAMLLKKPMVVSYRLGNLSFAILSRLVKTPYISLPNLLSNRLLVPEFIQDAATSENLSAAVLKLFNGQLEDNFKEDFLILHDALRLDSGMLAAAAIEELIQ
ncbi:MAG: lipid-A-disaccharide synthase [Cellvibrionales bacterium TMED49]|nr:MAG: lipid-A-disaccharide synthase [Cellvibrionales bacterium TMED49]